MHAEAAVPLRKLPSEINLNHTVSARSHVDVDDTLLSNNVSHAKFVGSIVLVVHAFLWGCLSGATSENQFNECLECWYWVLLLMMLLLFLPF